MKLTDWIYFQEWILWYLISMRYQMRGFEEKEDRMNRRKHKILLIVQPSFIFLKEFDSNLRQWRELQESMMMEEEMELVELSDREGEELVVLT